MTNFVIPALAGISSRRAVTVSRHSSESWNLTSVLGCRKGNEIPASAGMTWRG